MVKNFVERVLNGLLYDAAGDDGGGAEGVTPGADNNGAAKPGDGIAKPNDGVVKPEAAAGKPVEDPRIKGFIADLQKERLARQTLEANHKKANEDLERERKRFRLLTSDNPQSDDEVQSDLVKAQLKKLYPELGSLTSEDIAELKAMRAEMAGMKQATEQQWKTHAVKMLDSVTTAATKELGGKLSDRQTERLKRAYIAEAEANPAFLARHESGDTTLAAEFVKEWVEDFVEPGKRSALAQEVARRPRVPGGKDRSVVGHNAKPIDVTNDAAVEDALVAGFRSKGGQFGRRS